MEAAVIARVIIAVALTVVGLAVGRGSLARAVYRAVTLLLLYFSMPILTWYTVGIALPRFLKLIDVMVVGFAYIVVALVAVTLLTSFAGKRLGWNCRVKAAVTLASVFQNAFFLPLPVVLLLGGTVEPIVAYGIAFSTMTGFAVPFIASRCSPSRGPRGLWEPLRGLLTYPPFYGLLAGIATIPLSWQLYASAGSVIAVLKSVASEATLLSFYLVGASIALTWPPRIDSAVVFTALWRLLISPIVHLGLAALLGLGSWLLKCVLIESIMPPATMNLVFSEYYRLETSVVASSIAFITLLSLALVGLLAISPP
ncbi:hypothetical protein [Hyperthermus butylicus]|uniref:Uncharacterized protein n=1 Tax=Hyperthermus butylicus (strain DSM 5456 / JCM 9403 / PLM1-5) TaxID=415426 RepID=A2BMI8_HYPBU|nr:hypothetical protein [Hyperthermus butylicus]ABM81199.1 hypothetical protein Hbut_1374 [Hyperthermus butylicus DSM 5456]